jgi:hypothetical protein
MKAILATLSTVLCAACSGAQPPEDDSLASDDPGQEQVAPNTLTPEEHAAGWRLLFDGVSLDGWRGYDSEEVPEGWRAEDGTLHRFGGRGDIVTVEAFTDFELSLEWKVGPAGNSGIMYLGALGSRYMYHSAPEFQVLDDAGHADGADPLTSAGANYGLHPAPRGVVRPAGEWNHARIVVQDRRVEHWLNGQKVVEYVLGSPEWQELVAGSKFTQWPEYGTAATGHIGLQDHGDPVWYRNIKIRALR